MRSSSATASTSGRREATFDGRGENAVGLLSTKRRRVRHRSSRPPSAAGLGSFPSLSATPGAAAGCATSTRPSLGADRPRLVTSNAPKRRIFRLASSSDGDRASSSTTTTETDARPTSTLSAAELDARIDVARSTGRLDLSECGLTSVPDAVALLGACGLEDLSLAGNPNLTSLPEWIGEALPSLRRLQAAGCGLRRLPASIAELRALEGLWVHGCKIESLPEGIGDGPLGRSLRSLSLAGNRLRELPSSVGGLSSLVEAGLAGNRIARLPREFGGMTSLRKLQLHGNLLGSSVDDGGGDETDEEREARADAASLAALPEESLATLRSLTHLTLQANRLTRLPECLGKLPLLEDLNVADNELRGLPLSLGASRSDARATNAPSLKRLTAYGNRIGSLPPLLGRAPSLTGLWLEGNPLSGGGGRANGRPVSSSPSSSPSSGGEDDELHSLLVDASRASSSSSSGSSSGSPPSSPAAGGAEADAASVEAGAGVGGGGRRRVGLDSKQLSSLSDPAVAAAASAAGVLAPPSATLVGDGRRGYWKLEAGPGGSEWVSRVAEGVSRSLSLPPPPEVVDGSGAPGRRGLVVAFGSAPGEPNWGGLLSKIRRNAADSAHAKFDVLYVVDGARSWYNGGDLDDDENGDDDDDGSASDADVDERSEDAPSTSSSLSLWTEPIAAAARAYDGAVLLLGDSMGATGALLCCGAVADACRRGRKHSSPSASSPPARPRALAFCPQVDLSASSIRPAESEAWMRRLKRRAVASVSLATSTTSTTEGSDGGKKPTSSVPLPMRVDVHVGSWQHDVAQAAALQEEVPPGTSSPPSNGGGAGATVKVWSVPSHRLAAALDSRGELEPLVRSALLSVMGFSDGRGVRISNVL